MNRLALFLILIALFGPSESLWASDPLTNEAEAAMNRAAHYFRSISINGGYVGMYSLDLRKRYGESLYEKAGSTEIWVQPPGTPTVGQSYLRAWRLTGDRYYLDAARDVARALVWGQRQIGGWNHRVDVGHLKASAKMPVRKSGRCTFDDNITQGALKFLIDADSEIDEPWLTDGVELGIAFMLKSQAANGAWTQWYPPRGGYHDYYTFNDKSINDCIGVMLHAHKAYGKEEHLACAQRGGDFIIAAQFPKPQAGWAQQYNRHMKPAWARSFEPPGLCSVVTARNITTLVQLYLHTKDAKYLAPIPEAIEWLDKSRIGKNLWARLYEVGSNRPIYGDREDGYKVHYDYEKISRRERISYGWRGEYRIGSTIRNYRRLKAIGAQAYLAEQQKELSPNLRAQRLRKARVSAQKVIVALDRNGRWITDNMVTSQTFVRNINILCDYLELAKPAKTR